MLWRVGYFFGVGRVDVGVVEEAGGELSAQDARNGAIDLSFRHSSLVYLLDETRKGVCERQFYVYS